MKNVFAVGHLGGWLLAILLVAGCDRQSPEALIASGKDHLARGEYAAAVIQFKNAVDADPARAESSYLLGIARHRVWDLSIAEIELRKALDLGFDRNLAVPALARVLIDAGHADKALKELASAALTDAAARAEASALTGKAFVALARPDEARDVYVAALEADPADTLAKIGLASLKFSDGDQNEARRLLDEVLSARPDTPGAHLLDANWFLRAGRTAEAITAFEKAVGTDPSDIVAHAGLVRALAGAGRLDDAERRHAAMARIAPRSISTLYAGAIVDYARHDLVRARGRTQALLRMAPDDVRAQALGGAVEHDSGNYASAEKLLRRVVAALPADMRSRRLLASTYLRSGDARLARDTLAPLLASRSADADVLFLAGRIADALGDSKTALSHYEKSVAAAGEDPEKRLALGVARLHAGQTEQGIADLTAVARSSPDGVAAELVLVRELVALGKTDRAAVIADDAVARRPDNAASHHARALVARARGDAAAAREALEKALAVAPSYLPAAQLLAEVQRAEGRSDAARETLATVTRASPGNVQAVLQLATLMERTGAPRADVVAVLDKAIGANMGSVPLRVAKVDYLGRIGDTGAALDAAMTAQASIADDQTILLTLARTQLAAGQHAQASATFGKLAGLMPQSAVPLLGQAELRAVAGEWQAAHGLLQRAIVFEPDYLPARTALVDVSLSARDYDTAADEAREIQRKWPLLAAGYLAEVKVLVARGDAAGAGKVFHRGTERARDSAMIAAFYGYLLQAGQDGDAEVEKWLARHPGDVGALLGAGDRRAVRQEWRQAEAWYRRAVAMAPRDATARNNLAFVLGELKDRAALEHAGEALALAPDHPGVLDTAGMLNVQFGNVDEGLRLLRAAAARAPGTISIRLNLARALAGAGETKAARRQLEEIRSLGLGDAARAEVDRLLATL